jgi:hypothetical protein
MVLAHEPQHAASKAVAVDPSFTFQVQDDGGTANGGIDLDPTSFGVTPPSCSLAGSTGLG